MRKKFFNIGRELGDRVIFPKLFSAYFKGFFLRGTLIEEPKAMDVLMEKYVKDVGFE